MDGFTGLKSPAGEELPDARVVMVPFHVVHLAGNTLDERRGAFSKNSTTGVGGPRIPTTRPAGCLHTRSCLFTLGQQYQILDLFSSDEYVALEVTWSAYQNITWRPPRAQHPHG